MDRKTDLRLWAVLFWLAVWQIAAMALAAVYPHGELLLASPADVLLRLGQLAVTAAFWRTVAWSAVRIFGGFLLATVLAVALAALAAWKQWLRGLMAPLVAAVKTMPVASFIILALVWLNSRSLSLFISALMVFPPVYLNVLEGICRTDRRLLEMARVFRFPLGGGSGASICRTAATFSAPTADGQQSFKRIACWDTSTRRTIFALRSAPPTMPLPQKALLGELGLADVGSKPICEYSGGMKRRLGFLARALLAPSDALILDEPFTGLDEENRSIALRCILHAAQTKPVLLASHEALDLPNCKEVRL